MFGEYYGKLLAQLALDYNCAPEDLKAKENVVTVSRLNEGRRSYTRRLRSCRWPRRAGTR